MCFIAKEPSIFEDKLSKLINFNGVQTAFLNRASLVGKESLLFLFCVFTHRVKNIISYLPSYTNHFSAHSALKKKKQPNTCKDVRKINMEYKRTQRG